MRGFYASVFFALLVLIAPGETLWEFRADSGDNDTAALWFFSNGYVKPSPLLDHSSALVEPLDRTANPLGQKNYMGYLRRLPRLPATSFRFMFAFDSIVPIDTLSGLFKLIEHPAGFVPAIPLLELLNDYYSDQAYLRPFFSWKLIKRHDRFYLIGTLSLAGRRTVSDTLPLQAGVPYCLEYRLDLTPEGAARGFETRVNGKTRLKKEAPDLDYRFKDYLISLGNLAGERIVAFTGHLHFDNLALGTAFQGSPPRPPLLDSLCLARSRAGTAMVILYNPPYRPGPAPSARRFSQYQIQYNGLDWTLPLFTSDTNQLQGDSTGFDLSLPHNAGCLWRVRHFDSLGNTGDWSLPAPLAVSRDSVDYFKSRHPSVTALLLDGRDPIREKVSIRAGAWFPMTLFLDNPAGWSDLGYFIFWAHNAGYVEGNPYNRGGRFKAASNYVVNVSFNPDKAFEKRDEDQMRFTRLVNSQGLYVDFRDASVSFDSARKRVDFRVRFLSQAAPGPWIIKGYVRNSYDRSSRLYSAPFEIRPVPWWRSHAGTIGLAGVLLIIPPLALFGIRGIRRRRSRPRPVSRSQEIFAKFEAFVNDNLGQDLDTEAVERHMGMTSANLRRFVQENSGKGIKQYILDRKLDHARGLLETTNLNVTEVMSAAGFGNSAHFTQAFKKHTGQTPTDYRKKVRG